MGTADIWAFIPVQAQPAQIAEHALAGPRAYAWLIQVFDTQYELSTCAASKELRQQCRAQVAEMQVAGWTGRVATTYQISRHFSDHGQPVSPRAYRFSKSQGTHRTRRVDRPARRWAGLRHSNSSRRYVPLAEMLDSECRTRPPYPLDRQWQCTR